MTPFHCVFFFFLFEIYVNLIRNIDSIIKAEIQSHNIMNGKKLIYEKLIKILFTDFISYNTLRKHFSKVSTRIHKHPVYLYTGCIANEEGYLER